MRKRSCSASSLGPSSFQPRPLLQNVAAGAKSANSTVTGVDFVKIQEGLAAVQRSPNLQDVKHAQNLKQSQGLTFELDMASAPGLLHAAKFWRTWRVAPL